jgi:hypothetical protein
MRLTSVTVLELAMALVPEVSKLRLEQARNGFHHYGGTLGIILSG